MLKVKCSFCNATTYFGECAVENGWGRARGNINQIKLNIIHCPKHYKEAYDSLRDIGQIASTGSSKNGTRK